VRRVEATRKSTQRAQGRDEPGRSRAIFRTGSHKDGVAVGGSGLKEILIRHKRLICSNSGGMEFRTRAIELQGALEIDARA